MVVTPPRRVSAVLFAAFAVLSGLAISSAYKYGEMESEVTSGGYANTIWTAAQAEIELGRFLHALDGFTHNDVKDNKSDRAARSHGDPAHNDYELKQAVSADELKVRFNVLKQRIWIYKHGNVRRNFGNEFELMEVVDDFVADLERIENEVLTIRPGDFETETLIRTILSENTQGLRKITAANLRADVGERATMAVYHEELRGKFTTFAGLAVVALFVLLMFLVYSERAARRLLGDAVKARAEADEARQQLVNAIENINEGFVIYDADDRLVLCNQKYKDVYRESADLLTQNTTFEEIIRKGAERGQYTEAIGRVDAWVAERMARRRQAALPVEQPLKDGRWLMVSDRRTKDGRIVGVRTDITELKAREIQLQVAQKHLESQGRELWELAAAAQEANRAKSEFLAMISHEIRTPMNAIIGFSHLLNETSPDPEQRVFSNGIEESSNRLLGLVNDILDFSRLESGRMKLEDAAFNLRETIDNSVGIGRALVAEKPVEVTARIGDDVPAGICGDADRLYQILLNLIGNAAKFTQAGRVELAVDVRREETAMLHFEVRDTGHGITEDVLQQLFQPFEQGKAGSSQKATGTGLGLSICKRFVELMGGRISIGRHADFATTFYFEIPLVEAELPDASQEGAVVPELSSDTTCVLRILVAEDAPASQLVIKTMLEKRGHKVQTVADGTEAVDLAKTGVFDLILMDMQMPYLDGIGATKRIRELPAPANAVPIAALTAQTRERDRERALAAGMSDYLTKPIRPTDLGVLLLKIQSSISAGRKRALVTEDVSGGIIVSDRQRDQPSNGLPAPDSAPPASPPVNTGIDKAVLDEMAEAVGADIFAKLIGQFRQNTELELERLNAAIDIGDPDKLKAIAHKFVGLYSQFGFPSIAELATLTELAEETDVAQLAKGLSDAAKNAIVEYDDTFK